MTHIVASGSHTRAVTVTVVSRTASNAAEVCYVANVRPALSTRRARFRPLTAERCSAATLGPVSPRIVLNCASHQSPWEGTHTLSAWTALLCRRGFGFTLPL